MTTCQVCLYKKNGVRCSGQCHHSAYSPTNLLAVIRTGASSPLPGSVISSLTQYITFPFPPTYSTFHSLLTQFPLNESQLTQLLHYVYTKPILTKYAAHLSHTPATLATFFLKCATWAHHPTHLKHLKTLQCRWRENRESGLYLPLPPSSPPPLNEEDPFTLEPLNDLPKHTLWKYQDAKGHWYGFHSPSLYHYIDTHGPYNPYTRECIPTADIDRLYHHVRSLSFKDLPDFTVVWTTPRDAFVDVLYEYETLGYYTQVAWFLNLTPHRIIAIYTVWNEHPHLGREAALGFPLDPLYSAIIEDPETGAAYQFARDLRAFIRSSTELKFYGVAHLFLILGRFSPEIRRHLPSWISLVGNAIQT